MHTGERSFILDPGVNRTRPGPLTCLAWKIAGSLSLRSRANLELRIPASGNGGDRARTGSAFQAYRIFHKVKRVPWETGKIKRSCKAKHAKLRSLPRAVPPDKIRPVKLGKIAAPAMPQRVQDSRAAIADGTAKWRVILVIAGIIRCLLNIRRFETFRWNCGVSMSLMFQSVNFRINVELASI